MSNPRDEMTHFVKGVFYDLLEECLRQCFMVTWKFIILWEHAQKVEESRLKRNNRDVKRARPYDVGISKG